MNYCMKLKLNGIVLALLCLGFALVGILPVLAEDTAIEEEIIEVPIEGVSIFKYSPAGFSINQPDGIATSVSEFGEHQVIIFENNNNFSVLTVDVTNSGSSLDESVAAIKANISQFNNYKLESEEETTIGDIPAYKIKYSHNPENSGEDAITLNVTQIISINNGLLYVLTMDVGTEESLATASEMIETIKFVPIEDDNVSKMIKSKFQKMTKPDKSFFDIYNGYYMTNLFNSGNSFNSNFNVNSGNSVNSDNIVNSGNNVNSGNTVDSGNTVNSENAVDSGNTVSSGNTVASDNKVNSENVVDSQNEVQSGNTVASDNKVNSENAVDSGNAMNSNNQVNTGNMQNQGNMYANQNVGTPSVSPTIPYLYWYAMSYYNYQPPFVNYYSFSWV